MLEITSRFIKKNELDSSLFEKVSMQVNEHFGQRNDIIESFFILGDVYSVHATSDTNDRDS